MSCRADYAASESISLVVCFVGLHKGVPPLFVNLRSLYTDQQKVDTIQSLLLQYKQALNAHGHFSPREKKNPREPASALLWTYYYLAQHYDYLGMTENALKEIDAALAHTPTLIELFVTKGRIYKVSEKALFRWVNGSGKINCDILIVVRSKFIEL